MLKNQRVRLGQVRDLLMQLDVNEVDEERIREENG